jgi:hypothetical protein
MLFHVYVYFNASVGFLEPFQMGLHMLLLSFWHIFQYPGQTWSVVFIPKKEVHWPDKAGVFRGI